MAKSSAPIKLSGTVLNSETGMCICSCRLQRVAQTNFIYLLSIYIILANDRGRESVYDDLDQFGSR